MLNTNKLKGKIVEQGLSVEAVAQKMGIHRSTFYRKLVGDCQFTIHDADELVNLLHLSKDEAVAIFFNQEVADMRMGGEKNYKPLSS